MVVPVLTELESFYVDVLLELFSLTAYGPSGSRGTDNLCIILCPGILLIYNSPVPIFSPLWRDTVRFN